MRVSPLLSFSLAAITVQSASAGFHLLMRYQNLCEIECTKKTNVCYPKHYVEWRVGAVPSSEYNCGAFQDNSYFPDELGQWGQDFDWNGYNVPDICGFGSVDLWVANNGQTLEAWKHGADPGEKVATCYKQQGDEINCGDQSCFITKVHDAWVCADTSLCG